MRYEVKEIDGVTYYRRDQSRSRGYVAALIALFFAFAVLTTVLGHLYGYGAL